MIQEQGDHETTLLSQSQSVRVIQDSGGGEQGAFSDLAQGEGEGSLFQFTAGGIPESVTRGNQPPLFIDQFMSARQTASLPEGTGSPVVMSTTDHLKLTQSLVSGDRSGTTTSMSGMPQTIHLELPSHDSGPLNVRISMMDQTVHTQFTTDRNDLGALLFMRQDQLQQNLIKSGLELGQFQVHVNQEGRQDALPDRQSRRNDGAPEQQLASQDHNPQAQDRDRPSHHSMRALSLFA
jgi:flagellar hook-length control protein FliK